METPALRQQLGREIREKSHPLVPIATDTAPEITTLSGIRCVAFDVYGTLLISAAGEISSAGDTSQSSAAFATTAEMLGLSREQATLVANVFHQRISAHHERARHHGVVHPEVDIRAIWHEATTILRPPRQPPPEMIALAYELDANPVWPMPGARGLLQALKDRGVRVAIVSNAQFYTPLIIEELFGESLPGLNLKPCIWSYEVGEAKPSPAPFRALTDRLFYEGITPGETLYLGNDMLNDIVTAQNVGLRAVLFAGDARSLRYRDGMTEIARYAPDAVVTALEQVTDVIESL